MHPELRGPNAQASIGMLSPTRVLDLTDERGIFCSFVLAELGADVVCVEPPDGVRRQTNLDNERFFPRDSSWLLTRPKGARSG